MESNSVDINLSYEQGSVLVLPRVIDHHHHHHHHPQHPDHRHRLICISAQHIGQPTKVIYKSIHYILN